MKKESSNEYKVGVIVGRFQMPMIAKDDENIFNHVFNMGFDDVIVVIGIPAPAIKATKQNPLDFDARRRMIQEAYGNKFQIFYIKDIQTDKQWSENLDSIISTFAGKRDAVIFGTENVVKHYTTGTYKCEEYTSPKVVSNDAYLRDLAGKKQLAGEAWRAGVVWATQNRYNLALPTVDCFIMNGAESEPVSTCWMARKPNETKLRFVGGFVDPVRDTTFEDTAKREAKEETGLDCVVLDYIGNFKIDDWRFRSETDKIFTTFYALKRVGGVPKADDDIEELTKVDIMKLTPEDVVYEHKILLNMAQAYIMDIGEHRI